jgi:hypothetical protein
MRTYPVTELQVLCFFCKDNSEDTSTGAAIMSNLIDQLIGRNTLKPLLRILKKAHRENAKSPKCTNFKLLWEIFAAMARELPTRVVVVVDALDECRKDRSAFLDRVLSSNEEMKRKVQFFLTSRHEHDISQRFNGHHEIVQCGMSVGDGIKEFVVQRVQELDRLQLSGLRDQIIDEVPGRAAGMFRYAALLLDELNSPSTTDIADLLNSPPIGLGGMYEHILKRLDAADNKIGSRQIRKKIFSWVAVAKRPLTVKELAYVCAVGEDGPPPDTDKRILMEERDILAACGSLIEIVNGRVQYTHLSAKEFLLWGQREMYLKERRELSKYYLAQGKDLHALVGITCGR